MSNHRGSRFAAKTAGSKYYVTGKPCPKGHVAERDVKSGRCRECNRLWSRARAQANPGEWARRSRAKYHANPGARYGLTVEQYRALIAAHENRCAVCRAAPKAIRHAVDHDHHTGVVRGLLCDACNRGLGYFRDSPELLQRASEYLAERAAWLQC